MRPRTTITNRLTALGQTSETQNALPLLWIALAVAVYQVATSGWSDPTTFTPTSHSGISSNAAIASASAPWTWNALRGIVIVSACLWSALIAIPMTCWLTTLGYLWIALGDPSGNMHPTSAWNFPFWILAIYAVWTQLYRHELRVPKPWKATSWPTERACPAWVPFLCVYSLATQATLSGIQQLMMLGGPMTGGLSLQVALRTSGDLQSQLVQYLISDRSAAACVYVALLTVQCLAFLAICFRPLRTAIGLGLITVQVFDFLTFGVPRPGSTVLIAAVFLPWQDVSPVIIPKLKRSALYVFGSDH